MPLVARISERSTGLLYATLALFLSLSFTAVHAQPADAAFLPGDIVAWRLPGGLYHIGIVAPARAEGDKPVVIHNIGSGARREDVLREWKIIGHYRW